MLKKKIFNNQILIDYITKSPNFKIILLFTILTSIYGVVAIGSRKTTFFEMIVLAHNNTYYNIMFFSILTVNTINTCRIFMNNYAYVTRLETRKKYLKELLKIVIEVNLILILINILSYLAILVLVKLDKIKIKKYLNYNINNLNYSIFLLLKYYIFAIILSSINTLIYEYLNENKTMIIDLVFIALFGLDISSIFTKEQYFSILPWSYYRFKDYITFQNELISTISFFLILSIILLVIFLVVSKRKKLLYRNLNNQVVKNNENRN